MARNEFNSDQDIALECLRLAVEFGSETQREKPLDIAQKYFDWVKQVSKGKSCTCKTSTKKVELQTINAKKRTS